MKRLGNNEGLKTLTKTLTFVDADANAGGSTKALHERCSGELIKINFQDSRSVGHLGFSTGSVLAILYLLGALLFLIKIQFN